MAHVNLLALSPHGSPVDSLDIADMPYEPHSAPRAPR